MIRLPVARPVLDGNEIAYVTSALEAGQVSGGNMVAAFEAEFARWLGVGYAMACSSGTAGLHLALAALGVGRGDEVIVPALTFVATANAAAYCGARPVIVDVDPWTWCMDVGAAERAITPRTKAIVAVHLYGAVADLGGLRRLAEQAGVALVEDAAEGLGSWWVGDEGTKGGRVGRFGRVGVFSFYGNKLITTGEGGMVVTDDEELAGRIRVLRGQGRAAAAGDWWGRWMATYWHERLGFNYRMSELAGAVGLAQLKGVERRIAERVRVQWLYRTEWLEVRWQATADEWVMWMNAGLVESPAKLAAGLEQIGIETRPVFWPLHLLPMYRDGRPRPVAERLHERGIVLPSWGGVGEREVWEMRRVGVGRQGEGVAR